MPTNIPVGYAQAAMEYTGAVGTEPYVTTFGVDTRGLDLDSLQTLADDLFRLWSNAWIDYTSAALTFQRVRLTVNLAGEVGSVLSTNGAQVGEATGSDRVPTAMSLICTKQSANLGRRNRGRSFIPGVLTEGAVDQSGNILEGTRETYVGVWTNFIEAVSTASPEFDTTHMVILHADGGVPSQVLTGNCASKVGWIRKRIR